MAASVFISPSQSLWVQSIYLINSSCLKMQELYDMNVLHMGNYKAQLNISLSSVKTSFVKQEKKNTKYLLKSIAI